VVIDFMRDHRGFGEFASVAMRAAAELGRQALKGCIQVDALIARAIKWSHC
jgi:hypothetical protein